MKRRKICLFIFISFLCIFSSVSVEAGNNKKYSRAYHLKETSSVIKFLKKHRKYKNEKKSKYATCRIIVKNNTLEDDYGSTDRIYSPLYEEHILQYKDQAHTKKAYKKLKKIYGKQCYVDRIISSEDLCGTDDNAGADNLSPYITWGFEAMDFECAATARESDHSVTLAIIDTGCDMDNWYFKKEGSSRFAPNSYDFVENDNIPQDESSNGHGTHVAGIAQSCTSDKVSLLILKVFDGDGHSSEALIDMALQYAINQGADVINMSLGKYNEDGVISTCWDDSINQAYTKDIVICCSSGNNAEKGYGTKDYYPACSEKTVTVGAVDQNNNKANFSCEGETLDFCGPGVNIISALKGGSYPETKRTKGTSMATPHVAAAFACLKSQYPYLTIKELYQLAVNKAKDLGNPGWDSKYGHGLIQMGHNYITRIRKATPGKDGASSLLCSHCNSIYSDTKIPYPSRITAATSFAYSGKKIQPKIEVKGADGKIIPAKYYGVAYKNNVGVGTGSIVITFKDLYDGKMSKNFEIRPLAPKSIKIRKKSKVIESISWKKNGPTSYYQIESAANGIFRKERKIMTIRNPRQVRKKLRGYKRGKKYYFRMRTVTLVKGKKYYSSWSKIYKK